MGSVSLCRDEDNSSPHLPCQADPLSGSDGCCLVPLLSAGGPGGLLAPGTVGVCGSMAAGHTRNPDSWRGAAPWDPPFAGVVHGVWTLHPRATCRSLPAPSRAPGRIPCVRTGAEEFSGGNWMVPASPRYAGGAAATGRLVRPFHLTTFYPLGVGHPA
ncbi:hypothetical protein N7534_012128 [Penicillium rubens]|nr:hypothetical protein N7534_012128 [Penicillium rubens]